MLFCVFAFLSFVMQLFTPFMLFFLNPFISQSSPRPHSFHPPPIIFCRKPGDGARKAHFQADEYRRIINATGASVPLATRSLPSYVRPVAVPLAEAPG